MRTGYEVIRVRRSNGRVTGRYEEFVTGLVGADTPDARRAAVRPGSASPPTARCSSPAI